VIQRLTGDWLRGFPPGLPKPDKSGLIFFLVAIVIEPLWRQAVQAEWKPGKTTDADVIKVLGPPSQIITLGDQSVYYYLREKNRGKAYIFILWNQTTQSVEYDRAIFFFDKKGVLLKYSYSKPVSASNAK
jgi:outer membrane protein assembly factor BamE (lipoprotein component of BamABCDE complex)